MRLIVQRSLLCVSWFVWKQTQGKSDRNQDGRCHESKLQLELKMSVNIHPQSTKSESIIAVKILTASYENKLINIHDLVNPTSLFPDLGSLWSCTQISRCTQCLPWDLWK